MRSHADGAEAVSLPRVAVYRDVLLNPNEPFIRAQAEALTRYQARYFCMRRVDGLDLPAGRTFALHGGGRVGRALEDVFKRSGLCPALGTEVAAARPSLIHAYTGVDAAVVLPLARRLALPLAVTFTGFDATATDAELRRSSRRCWTFMRRREQLRGAADLTIAVSQFIKNVLVRRRGYGGDQVAVHYIGVDVELFRADPRIGREQIVLFVGRLIEMKGLTYLIRAVRDVQTRVRDAELVVAGDGELRDALEREARASGTRVRFLGFRPPDEVRSLMNRAKVLCVPSIEASNGMADSLPLVALEAQAMGLPVVAFESGGLSEEVLDGETGLLAPERDVASLARHVETLLSDQPLWDRLSQGAPRFVRRRFDLRQQAASLETLYDRVRAAARVTA